MTSKASLQPAPWPCSGQWHTQSRLGSGMEAELGWWGWDVLRIRESPCPAVLGPPHPRRQASLTATFPLNFSP